MATSPRKVKEEPRPAVAIVGANVYRLRVLRVPKLSQEDLHERSGVATETIRLLEQSRDQAKPPLNPRLSTLDKLAAALDVTVNDLTATPSKPTGEPRHLSIVPDTGGALPIRG
jgi:transcriptional regulator with XRE-family HTH domain